MCILVGVCMCDCVAANNSTTWIALIHPEVIIIITDHHHLDNPCIIINIIKYAYRKLVQCCLNDAQNDCY